MITGIEETAMTTKIRYKDLQELRAKIIAEIQVELGIMLSVNHYILAEHRVQTAIQAGLLIKDMTAGPDAVEIIQSDT